MSKMKEKKRKVNNLKIRKAGNLCSSLYQWSTGKRWYWINRNNMQIEGPAESQCNLFNALLVGLIVGIKGSYDRNKKTLQVVL